MTWKLSEAKERLNDLFRLAYREGPQRIKQRGETVVVISEAEYNRLSGTKSGFKELLFSGPSLEGLDLERDRSGMRDAPLWNSCWTPAPFRSFGDLDAILPQLSLSPQLMTRTWESLQISGE